MTETLVSWITLGGLVAILGFLWNLHRDMINLRRDMTSDMDSLRRDMTSDMENLRRDMTNDMNGLRRDMANDLTSIRERLAKLEGAVDILIAVMVDKRDGATAGDGKPPE